jgi:hypothetical protein
MLSDHWHRPDMSEGLSDECVVELLGCLQDLLTTFENRYAHQISRYYDAMSECNITSRSPLSNQDPRF